MFLKTVKNKLTITVVEILGAGAAAVRVGFPTRNPQEPVIQEEVAGVSDDGVCVWGGGQQVALQHDNLTLKRLSGCKTKPEEPVSSSP